MQRSRALLTTCFLLNLLTGRAEAAVLFFDDFSATTGWTLTNTWQIGPAMASPAAHHGSDPAFDHTPTADNRLLGAAIGGNVGAPDGLHPFWWATSPVINASSHTGITLDFYRWLNSDYDPYMTSRVEGWDGDSWEVIWTTAAIGTNPTDASWVYQSFDVSSLANNNPAFQVRFGYDVTQAGVFIVSGWNVDDVLVTSDTAAIPEPTSLALLGMTAAGFCGVRLRRRRTHDTADATQAA